MWSFNEGHIFNSLSVEYSPPGIPDSGNLDIAKINNSPMTKIEDCTPNSFPVETTFKRAPKCLYRCFHLIRDTCPSRFAIHQEDFLIFSTGFDV